MALAIDQVNALTQKLIHDTVADNYFDSQALLYHLKSRAVKVNGGVKITFPVVNAGFSSKGSFSGVDTWSAPTYEQATTAAEFDWKQVRCSFVTSELDILKNADSRLGIVNLGKTYAEIAKMTLTEELSDQLQSDGTGNSSKDVTGLQATLSASSTYGNIQVADMATWIAAIGTLSNPGELTLPDMQRAYLAATYGNDHPDLLLSRRSVFSKYMDLLVAQKRFVDLSKADGGFEVLTFNGQPFMIDDHVPGTDTTASCWLEFLNTKWLKLYVHAMQDMKVEIVPIQTTAQTNYVHLFWMGNLTCNNRRMQAVIKTVNPTL